MLPTPDFVQLVAAVRVLYNLSTTSHTYQSSRSHDCPVSCLAETPGNSRCSTRHACTNPRLLAHPGFIYRDERLGFDFLALQDFFLS